VRFRVATLAILVLAGPGPAWSDDVELPPRSEALVLLRVLSYDRNLAARSGSSVTIAVAWQTGDEAVRDDLLESLRHAASEFRVAGLPVRSVPVRWEKTHFDKELADTGATVVLVVGSLGQQAKELVSTFHALRLLSASSSLASVEAGIAIGLSMREGRAAVFINGTAAREAGADFDSMLFTVARLVGAPSPG
jgi:YfiR/HmsC-like